MARHNHGSMFDPKRHVGVRPTRRATTSGRGREGGTLHCFCPATPDVENPSYALCTCVLNLSLVIIFVVSLVCVMLQRMSFRISFRCTVPLISIAKRPVMYSVTWFVYSHVNAAILSHGDQGCARLNQKPSLSGLYKIFI